MSAQEASSFRLVASLGTAGLLSGLVLVGVFLTTKPRIERNQAEALEAAIFKVLPGTVKTDALVLTGERLEPYEGPVAGLKDKQAVFAGYGESGELVGYAIPADGPGYMDTIGLLFGFDPERKVIVGMEVLESRETPGLGDKIITDAAFQQNFLELAIEPEIVPVKKGAKTLPNEVDCITGATISSEAVISILERGLESWEPVLAGDQGVEEATRNGHAD